jgi:type IV secretory pathway VirB10-like protein
MTEGLFILTTIFVAYVVYAIIGEQRASSKSKTLAEKPETQVAAVEPPKPPVAAAKEKPAAAKTVADKSAAAKKVTPPVAAKPAAVKSTAEKPVAAKPAAPKAAAKPATTKTTTTAKPAATKKAPAPAAAAQSTGLKNPKTGEVATAYHNYRFTKRWIKDAFVAEGLLDKVYTANELNPEVDAKIKEAIAKLEVMDKYKA